MIHHTGFIQRTLFPSMLWRMPGRKVYLTFDDGPHPTATPAVLDALKRHNVRATFFLSGKNIAGREAIVQRIVRDGHSVGIHAFHHSRQLVLSKERTADEIRRTAALIEPLTGIRPRLFRPPYGFFSWNTTAAAKELGVILVMWSCLTGDFSRMTVPQVCDTALKGLSYGSILVFHDNDLTEHRIVEILDTVIPRIASQGFEFGAIR